MGAFLGDSALNQMGTRVFWETLVSSLDRFLPIRVGSFNFLLRKISSKLDFSGSSVLTLNGSSVMMGICAYLGYVVCIGSVVWVRSPVGLGSSVFIWSSVCMGTTVLAFVFFGALVPLMTILTRVFLLDLILFIKDYGFEIGPVGSSLGLGGVEPYAVISFVASIWLETTGSMNRISIKIQKGSCLMRPNIDWSLGRVYLLSSQQRK